MQLEMLRGPPRKASRPISGSRPTGWEALIYTIWSCEPLGSLQIDITSPPPN